MAAISNFTFLSITITFLVSLTQAHHRIHNGGFSVELLRRDSPTPPLYNPTETTPSERMANSLRRSANRVNYLFNAKGTPKMPQSTVICGMDVYLMKISLGTPPVEILGIVDTGSDLTWIQCAHCAQCYKQKAPLFDPKNSKSYKELSSHSTQCKSVSETSGSSNGEETCHYHISYGDNSSTSGVVSTDTVTFGSTTRRPVSFPQTIIGCGLNNSGEFHEEAAGMIGLGRGSESLISRMGSSIDGKFSYCLVDETKPNTTSKMNFGSSAVVSGFGAVSTPLFVGEPKSYYFLRLEAMSVGRTRLQYNTSRFSLDASPGQGAGNIIIDSGTTMTLLPEGFYNKLESTVSKAIKLKRLTGEYLDLGLCYNTTSVIKAPIVTAHFIRANVKLNALNTFMRMSTDVVCFAFGPSPLNIFIFGNMAQRNFLIGYDLKKGTVSFKPTDCTKH